MKSVAAITSEFVCSTSGIGGRFTLRRQIALQFPDELLHDSVPIYKRLTSLIGRDIEAYVLADTSYGR
jgi:diphthamide synthase subunit DPH2